MRRALVQARFNPTWWHKRPFARLTQFLARDVAFFERLDHYAERIFRQTPRVQAVFMGHTHVPMLRTWRLGGKTRTYVNTGTWVLMVDLGLGRLGHTSSSTTGWWNGTTTGRARRSTAGMAAGPRARRSSPETRRPPGASPPEGIACMSRFLVALLVGAGLGLGLYLAFRPQPAAVTSAPVVEAAAAPAPKTAAATVYVDRTHPGLVVTVRRAGAVEGNVKLELFRAEHELALDAHAWKPVGTERTDGEGRAVFPAAAALHLLVATATDGARATKAFQVDRSHDATWLELELGQVQRLTGQVLDAKSRQPIPGARVSAEPGLDPGPRPAKDWEAERSVAVAAVTADSFGKFALDAPAAPRWTLVGVAPGFQSASEGTDGKKPVELLLTAGATLEGRVVTPGGEPVAGASVQLAPGDVRQTVCDEQGRFAVPVPRAPISAHATAPDGRQALGRVVIGERDERARLELVVGPGSTLTGVVRAGGAPAPGALVHVIAEPEGLEVASLEAAADGTFSARALPAGRYSVMAQQGPARRATAVGLELPGAPAVELTLSAAGRLTGVVRDGANNPYAGATVKVSWPFAMKDLPRTAHTGEDGRFEFDELFPAELTVQATAGDLLSEETAVYVGPDATAELVLSIGGQGRLVGTVLSEKPVARVLIRKEYEKSGEAVDVVDGRFELSLAPGRYKLLPITEGTIAESGEAVVKVGEVTTVSIAAGAFEKGGSSMHPELGSGLSFENAPGGVRVDFLMGGCPAAVAGVQIGDLVVSIDGEPASDARDAFAKVRRPSGMELSLVVRRDGRDLPLTLK